jgi:hypothetical protein
MKKRLLLWPSRGSTPHPTLSIRGRGDEEAAHSANSTV